MQIDIRNASSDIDMIQFSDDNISYLSKGKVGRGGNWTNVAYVLDEHQGELGEICSKQHALDMIAALQKAIDLGWFN